eukprot:m51a1_g5764 putative 3 -cyclic-nucleotide phosphodiesterase (855) ;mRNA; f:1228866-1232219
MPSLPSPCFFALLLVAGLCAPASADRLLLVQATIMKAVDMFQDTFDGVAAAAAQVALQGEHFANWGMLDSSVNLSSLTFVGGPDATIADLSPSRFSEASNPPKSFLGGGDTCACAAERNAFCARYASAMAIAPSYTCMPCARACEVAYGLRLTLPMDAALDGIIPNQPLVQNWYWGRGNQSYDWGRIWIVSAHGYSLAYLNSTSAVQELNTGSSQWRLAEDRAAFDRTARWSSPYIDQITNLPAVTVAVPAWDKSGTFLGAAYADVLMASARELLLSLTLTDQATNSAMVISVSVVVPVVAICAMFGVVLWLLLRRMNGRVRELENQLGNVSDDVLGTPAEDVIKTLMQIKTRKGLPRGDKLEIMKIVALIASNKLFKTDLALKQKLDTLKLDKDVDAYLLDFLANRDGAGTPQPSGSRTGSLPYVERSDSRGSCAGGLGVIQIEEVEDAPEVDLHLVLPDGRTVGLESWELDIEALKVPASGSILEVIGLGLLDAQGMFDQYHFNRNKVTAFLRAVERGYNPNQYHNSNHAADVAQAMYVLMTGCPNITFTPLERLATVIAPLVHDYGHPGFNNNFLMATQDPLFIRYNGISVLESMHTAESMRLLLSPDYNFLKGHVAKEEIADLHKLIVQMILATDMSRHLEITSQFNTRTSSGELQSSSKADRLLIMQMFLKMADVSNPTRPWEMSKRWAERVMEEFYSQGDRERAEGLKLSPFMDRTTTDTAKCQTAFIKFVVLPMAESLAHVNPGLSKTLVSFTTFNAKKWSGMSNMSLALSATTTSRVPHAVQAAQEHAQAQAQAQAAAQAPQPSETTTGALANNGTPSRNFAKKTAEQTLADSQSSIASKTKVSIK